MSITKVTGKYYLLILSCLGPFLSLPAQSNLPPSSEFQIQTFTTDDGLPSNGIKGLQWDEETGFLWIATEAGIVRYNGADFMIFNRSNTPNLASDRMIFLLRNFQGRLCVSDESGNIFFIMKNRLEFAGQCKVDGHATEFKLIGLASSGKLFRQSSNHPPPGFDYYFPNEKIIPLNDNRLLLTWKDSLFDYTLGTPIPRYLASLEQDSRLFYLDDRLFVFSKHGIYTLNPDRPGMAPVHFDQHSQKSTYPTPALTDSTSLIWNYGMPSPILIEGPRAWTLSYDGQQLTSTLICPVVPTGITLASAQYVPQIKTLFLGTQSKGLITIRTNQVRPVKKQNQTSGKISTSTSFYSQVALPGVRILGNTGDILSPSPLSSHIQLPVRAGPDGRPSFLPFVLLASDSTLWYGREDSVFSYSYKTHHTSGWFSGKGSITNGFVQSGGILYIINSIGIATLQQDKIQYIYRYNNPALSSNQPFSATELEPDVLAIATCNGLLRYQSRKNYLDTLLAIPGTCVRALWQYKGYLFIGTYGDGIYIWKNGLLKRLPTDKYQYLRYAHCFMPDGLGYCWISTNKGIFRAKPEDMINAYEKDLPTVYYHYYGKKDGMDMTELNGGCTPCALSLNDSTLSFPSMDGLVWVDPRRPPPSLPSGDVFIDGFYADGKKINASSLAEAVLSSEIHEYYFYLSFPAWTNKENLYVEYKLEPYSKEWRQLEGKEYASIRFNSLPPGNYRLLIRKLNGFGENNYSLTGISFHVFGQWYQQPWGWALVICCLALLFMLFLWIKNWSLHHRNARLEVLVSEKTKELIAKNEELEKADNIKTRLISIMGHDVITPLKFIHMASKNLSERENEFSPLQKDTVHAIMNTAQDLATVSTNILNWIKYRNEDKRLKKQNFNVHRLLDTIFQEIKENAAPRKIELENKTNENLMIYQYFEAVKIILLNLLQNAINFTHQGRVRVSSSLSRRGVRLLIEDTGIGMPLQNIDEILHDKEITTIPDVTSRKGKGLGYLIVKDLLKLTQGTLSIESEPGKGTVVTIILPDTLPETFTDTDPADSAVSGPDKF